MTNQNYDFNTQEVPFFARYLEGQITQDLSEKELKQINGGKNLAVTGKYPSDADEEVTHKYPSDDDELPSW